ncbi:OmpA family protein [Imtechella halotolerans]|uniref:Peptidoglycan-associated (Lipo)protein n=1 Tax=Imtechella halotolerans K1 TaxID=946077 RepID=I0W8J3_9FLAO|nr:OmpA family protein [Imtechella halotolerans]EID72709.1 peptidoglycan-associated (lipo)protein [Imtechella halotolerans K1]WMQ64631.1 DUF4892 domain-containing protein [Imtechella halotolerans]
MKNNVIVTLLFCFHSFVNAQDVSNSKDHELLTRYPGTEIKNYYERAYYETRFAISPGSYEKGPEKWLEVSGKQTSLVYEAPKDRSTLEIMKNYEETFKRQNAEILFSCKGGECDGTTSWYAAKFFNTIYSENNRQSNGENDHYFDFGAYHVSQRYLVAKITTASKVYYIEIAATPTYDDKPVKILVEIMESDILQTGMIELNADIFKETLEKEGKIALYGILFDTGKTDIKKASLKEIELVSTYLKQHPKAHIYIVGHTDDVGNFGDNTLLSEGRAIKVTQALNQLGNFQDHVTPIGVGPVCPVATNETEEGRAKNRRVEIVLRKKF